jgi:phage/plasmid-associated DNA primase
VDESFWDRFLVLKCSQQFRGTSREVPGLASSLAREEMQGIARRALDGARGLLEGGRYAIPATSIGALREWLNQADAVALFLDEACVPSNDQSASKWPSATEVYETFCRWADRRGHQKMSYAELLQRIESRGHDRVRSNGTRLPLSMREQHQWDSRTWDVADDEIAPF